MISRFIYRFALLIVGVWALLAVAGNALTPPLERVVADEDEPFVPSGTSTALAVQRSAAAFSQVPTDNIAYLVLARNAIIDGHDREFYNHLITALRADSAHVLELTDWLRVPATADAATSDDQHVVLARMRLAGMVGTTEAVDSINAARGIVAQLHPPEGLRVYITGAGATVMDEFEAIDRQTQVILAMTFAVLLILLLIVYRSLITAMVPLVSVFVALSLCKPVVTDLASKELISISLFSLSVSVAVAVGAGTSFAMFLIGRYHERLRQGFAPAAALADAYRGVAPTIVGSALIVVAPLGALAWLSLARISMFASTGILCAIGVLATALSALTLTPALVALASRAGLVRPPQRKGLRRRWRRVGTQVARWPAPILVSSGILILILMIALPGVPIGWDETRTTSAKSESRRGYDVVDRHFPPNQLFPDVVTIETDHDIRTPAGLTALEQVTSAIMGISGVRMVQSASHPAGMVSKQAALTATAGNVGDRIDEFSDRLSARDATFANLDSGLSDLFNGLDLMQSGTLAGSYAIGGVSLAVHITQQAVSKIRARSGDVSEIFDPLRSFVRTITDCRRTPVCSAAQEATQWSATVVSDSTKLVDAAEQLAKAVADAATSSGLAGAAAVISAAGGQMAEIRARGSGLREVLNNVRPVPTQELPAYLHSLMSVSQGSPGVNLYASRTILIDPTMRPALDEFFSQNGHATRLYVYGNGHEWGDEGAIRARAISAAVADATKDGALKPATVELTGVGPVTRDLQDIIGGDLALLAVLTLGVILVISAALLRSPIAGLVVLGTIAASYVCALGASVLFWHRLLHHELHWSVPPIAFVSMIGVASGGNLLFALRIREGLAAGMRTSLIRAYAATGGVVTAGGIVVGIATIALSASRVLNVAQIGLTVGVGLLLNALVMRAFVLPAMMVVLDRWLWWPRRSAADEAELEPVTA
ncbi:transporter [Mycobacterium kiyosense]|uniref:MMPL/RND family transporter n=1 Tax=Mycobacterium kiyosense TaxID=2871094 RepID=UPI00216EF21B|nr:RND family transporter [Mycobacterium kiyosense]GLD03928.1 transporter [Mycobacterium kiyosense]GLD09913.1 transporter [Mycobacterium kiyosense]GLD15925.1 transporter [Mycobacterium kiyosense]GLD22139.1 transporter [Mycobacterium kiyosense]